uniref:Uncharacterized protein n=1 Tax=Panagrolaimus sp. JU765 TaxID=591449 RepID=A0AC34RMM8_9BILA
MSEEYPNIIAIQLLASKYENLCVAYDLKDGKEWKRFDLPTSIEKEDNWKEIYMKLSKNVHQILSNHFW